MAKIGPEVLGRLFDEQAPVLALYARQWCEVPEDVVQDAFVKLARLRTPPERPVPWLFRVVRNGAINASRGERNRRRREARSSGAEAWFSAEDDRIDARKAAEMLAELDAEAREVIIARFWGGLGFEEIARLQGCSPATAHRRYQGGLAFLNERLGGRWAQRDPAASKA